jgi:phosphohistidine phosphatase SixA
MTNDSFFGSEWITHQHRDTSSSIVGHAPLLSYLALADGESRARVKFELCEVSFRCDGRVMSRGPILM